MTKIDSWKPKHQASRLAQTRLNLRIWVSTDQAKAIPLVATKSRLSHMHLKLSTDKEKTHISLRGLRNNSIDCTPYPRAPSYRPDKQTAKRASWQHALHFGWHGNPNPAKRRPCDLTPGWKPEVSLEISAFNQIWKAFSLALSFGKVDGSRDPRRREGRTTNCPDSITLNSLMNKFPCSSFNRG